MNRRNHFDDLVDQHRLGLVGGCAIAALMAVVFLFWWPLIVYSWRYWFA